MRKETALFISIVLRFIPSSSLCVISSQNVSNHHGDLALNVAALNQSGVVQLNHVCKLPQPKCASSTTCPPTLYLPLNDQLLYVILLTACHPNITIRTF